MDLFCTNKPGLIRNISLVPGISDHDRVIVVDTHLKALINKKPRRQIPLWSKAKWDELENLTNEFNQEFSETSATRNIHENWNKFKDHDKLLQDKIPSKLSSTRYNLSWFDSDLKRLNRKKRRVYNKAIIAQTCLRSPNNYFAVLVSETPRQNGSSQTNYQSDFFFFFFFFRMSASGSILSAEKFGGSQTNEKKNCLGQAFTFTFMGDVFR